MKLSYIVKTADTTRPTAAALRPGSARLRTQIESEAHPAGHGLPLPPVPPTPPAAVADAWAAAPARDCLLRTACGTWPRDAPGQVKANCTTTAQATCTSDPAALGKMTMKKLTREQLDEHHMWGHTAGTWTGSASAAVTHR